MCQHDRAERGDPHRFRSARSVEHGTAHGFLHSRHRSPRVARETATLGRLSGGRLTLGDATWWLAEFPPETVSLDQVRGVLRDGPVEIGIERIR